MRKRESSLIHDLAMMELSSESEDERTVCPKCGLLFRVRICGFVATDVHVTRDVPDYFYCEDCCNFDRFQGDS